MNKVPFRSQGLPAGFFNELNTIHMHIDGKELGLVVEHLRRLEARSTRSKINYVERFIAGPQRQKLPEIYESHTPELAGEEAFEFFSTSHLKDRQDTIQIVNLTGEVLVSAPSTIIEVEQTVAWLGPRGWKSLPESSYVEAIQASEVRLTPRPSLEFEIHHGFDLPRGGPQIELEELAEFCEKYHIEFGGWFVFLDELKSKYRSNSFCRAGAHKQSETEQSALNFFLAKKAFGPSRTLVEKILGIWKS